MIWDRDSGEEGKPKHRALTIDDILVLHPFDWCHEFGQVIQKRGGFDVIISNPPWDIVRPNIKEFINEHPYLTAKYTITSKSGKKHLLEIPELREAWLTYESRLSYVRPYFYNAQQYQNQYLQVRGNEKRQSDAVYYYSLFIEQCYNLLRDEGQCGLVVPGRMYSDTRSKRQREMLFTKTRVTGLISFENRKLILEDLSPHVKFAIVTFEKEGKTSVFPATFNRWNIEDLENFPEQNSVLLSVNFIRRFSSDSLSIPECESELDVLITQKMLQFSSLREIAMNIWNLKLIRGFEVVPEKKLYELKVPSTEDVIPVYEGKIIQQFSFTTTQPRFWLGKQILLRQKSATIQNQEFAKYRLACRTISNNRNERTIIVTILPPEVIAASSIFIISGNLDGQELLFLSAILNSYVIDFFARLRSSLIVKASSLFQLQVPHLRKKDAIFGQIVERAARLVCTSKDFAGLWEDCIPNSRWSLEVAVTNSVERANIRAELDALIAHLYGFNEEEFGHILTNFPLVPEPILLATWNAYRDIERGLIK